MLNRVISPNNCTTTAITYINCCGAFFIMPKDLKFQREQVKKLYSQEKYAYEEASIYTVLFDLVEGNGLDEVFIMLHNVATDLEQREKLESKFEDAKKWEWS